MEINNNNKKKNSSSNENDPFLIRDIPREYPSQEEVDFYSESRKYSKEEDNNPVRNFYNHQTPQAIYYFDDNLEDDFER